MANTAKPHFLLNKQDLPAQSVPNPQTLIEKLINQNNILCNQLSEYSSEIFSLKQKSLQDKKIISHLTSNLNLAISPQQDDLRRTRSVFKKNEEHENFGENSIGRVFRPKPQNTANIPIKNASFRPREAFCDPRTPSDGAKSQNSDSSCAQD